MKVLIAGAGAIGGWLGARLAQKHDVTLLGRPPLARAMASSGLRIQGLTEWSGALPVITQATGHYDIVFLTCKAHQTANLAEAVAGLTEGPLVSLQNGLGNGEKLATFVPADRVAVALTSHGVGVEAPGSLRHAGNGVTKVGGLGDGSAGRVALEMLGAAGLEPQWTDDVRAAVWEKAIVNAGINPVAALLGKRNGAILEDPANLALSKALVTEAVGLAGRARVALRGDLWTTTQNVIERTAANRCSMLQDVQARRPTEIEQLTGRMVRLAEALLVPMPRSESVYGRIKDLETSYLGAAASEQTAWDELRFAAVPV